MENKYKFAILLNLNGDEITQLDKCISDWKEQGVNLTRSKAIRLAIEEFVKNNDADQTLLKGNLFGVRVDPTQYMFVDLIESAQYFKDLIASETNQTRKYFLNKTVELVELAINVEINVYHFIRDFKIKTEHQFNKFNFEHTNNLLLKYWGKYHMGLRGSKNAKQ